MTTPTEEVEQTSTQQTLTPEAQAVRAAADAKDAKPTAPAMPTPELIPRVKRLKVWWYGVRLKLVGGLNRLVGIVPVYSDYYHAAINELAKTIAFLEQSGALEHAPHARSKLGRGVQRILELLAAGEQMADVKSYQKTLHEFNVARAGAESRKRRARRAAAVLTLVKQKLNQKRGLQAGRRIQTRDLLKNAQ